MEYKNNLQNINNMLKYNIYKYGGRVIKLDIIMKIEKKQKESKLINIIDFPNKVNILAILLIIISYALIAALFIGLMSRGQDYVIVPEYEEMEYSDQINSFFQVSSNYTLNSNGDLTKADTIRYYYYGIDKKNSSSLKAQISAMYDDDRIVYYADKTSTAITYTGTSYVISGVSQNKNLTNIYTNVSYTIQNEATTYNYKFSEEILKLSSSDLKSENKNECLSESFKITDDEGEKDIKIFKLFSVSSSTSTTDNDEVLIKINFALSEESSAKYHLDLQMFAVDEDNEIYNLVGWYNLGNNAIKSYSKDCKITKSINLEDIYVKVRYLDINGQWHELLYKNSYSNI